MLEGRTKYYYNLKDKDIIKEYIKDNGVYRRRVERFV